MAEGAIRLQILTPQRLVLETQVGAVKAPSLGGYLEVLRGHAPMAVGLNVGALEFKAKDGRVRKAAVSGGIMYVRNNEVVILADSAELAAEIDVLRAREDLRKAQEALRTKRSEAEHQYWKLQMNKAINRLKVAGE